MAILKIGANEKIQIVKLGEDAELKIQGKDSLVIEPEGTKEKEEKKEKGEDKK